MLVKKDAFSSSIDFPIKHFLGYKRLVQALTEPGSKLLVHSPRRMGKTSAVMNAVETVNKNGGHALQSPIRSTA